MAGVKRGMGRSSPSGMEGCNGGREDAPAEAVEETRVVAVGGFGTDDDASPLPGGIMVGGIAKLIQVSLVCLPNQEMQVKIRFREPKRSK